MSQSDLNTFALCGRLTKDAEAAGDGSIAKMRLAVSGRPKPDGGDNPYYFDVVRFKAEKLIPHLTKGKQIIVSGRVEWREWEGESGKRQAVSFIANDLQFVGSKADSEAPAPAAPVDETPDWAKDE